MFAFVSVAPAKALHARTSKWGATPVNRGAHHGVWTPAAGTLRKRTGGGSSLKMVVDPFGATTRLISENPIFLQKIADVFKGTPEPLVQYGHPAMMALLILGMGVPGAYIGWQGRLNEDKRAGVGQKKLHENIMLGFFLLAFLGGTGGTLSTVMQGYDIWESPHAKSALLVLLLLAANSVIAYTGFTIGTDGTPKGRLQGRKFHAYFGIGTMLAFLVHIGFGVNILLG